MGVRYLYTFIPVICILATAPLLCAGQTWKRKIVVSQRDGIDNKTCWSGTETVIPCRTLDYALAHVTNSTLVQLLPDQSPYNLTRHFNFTNLHGFELAGDQNSIAPISCQRNQGSLSFENSRDITLSKILLRGCGGLHASTTGNEFRYPHIQFLSAVFFVYCKNIVIDNCWIVESPGVGLNMYDIGGVVQISNSWFESNRAITSNSSEKNIAIAGGGVYMELTYQGGAYPFDLNSTELAEFDSNSSYTFYNCRFRNNYAPRQQYETIVNKPTGDDHIPFGRGGGLSIFLKGKAQNNGIYVTGCRFEDNYAVWGGGIFIELHDEVQNNTFEVTNCTFKNNSAYYAGGAIRSGTTADSVRQWLLPNKMRYDDCRFEHNNAIWGGGVSYYETWSSSLKGDEDKLHIEYKNCHWENNAATSGSAIGVATQPVINGLQDFSAKGLKLYIIVLEDCSFFNNSIILTEDRQVIGQGAIYSYSLPVIFKGVVNIEYSNNTAMVIENAAVHISGDVTFRNNTGSQGGALGLYGTSVIMLMPHSSLNFFNNTADQQGGAIYMRDSGPAVIAFNTTELRTRQCFLAYNNSYSLENVTEWQTKIVFKGNQVLANGGGDSVFASTLQGCRQNGQPRINNQSLEWPNVIQYQDSNKSTKEQISTDPILIKWNEKEWIVSPSEVFDATIQLIDEKNSSVLGVVIVSIIDEHDQNTAGSVRLGTASHLFLVQGDSSKINNLYLVGNAGRSFKVQISTVVGRVVRSSSKGALTLQRCYTGFEQRDGKTCSCISSAVEFGISNCSADSKHVFLKRGYWGGMKGHKFSTYPCPWHYCNFPEHDSTFQYNSETMCIDGRDGTSVLCGKCKEGYSVNLGNEHCTQSCTNDYLGLVVAFGLLTPLLVLLVFRIKLDIFTTYLNTWLYSYQTILFLLQEGQYLDPFISFVIDVANWKLSGFGTCLYRGMTNLQKLGVNYTFPLYILLILMVLAKIARRRPACYINRNVEHAFCTLLVICYTNVTIISFSIVHYVPIQGRWVLYADGNIDFVKDLKMHLPFTIIACLWIVLFVIFVPLVLLFTPWFLRHFHYLNNFRLYFDTFEQCFKVKYRWFAAYYFICRIFILLIALYFPYGPLKRTILDVSSVLIVVMCLYLQPYNEQYQWFNRLDAVLLTNLCLIVNFSSGIVSEAASSTRDALEMTVNLLAYVPLGYLIVLVLYHGWRYCCPRNFLEDYRYIVSEQRPRSSSISDTAGPPSPI
ncbi:hypothetical protein ACROYT_G018282 [Oculina patagonica]